MINTPDIATIIAQAPAPIQVQDYQRHVLDQLEGINTGVGGTATTPMPYGVVGTQVMSTAFENGRALKNSAGKLHALTIYNSKASAQFILIINATMAPLDGTVTLLYPPIPIAASSVLVLDLPRPIVATTGIYVCNSSTGTFTKTIGSTDCVFWAQVTD